MSTYLTPQATARAIELTSRLFRKQILKFGEIDYDGSKVRFDRDFAEQMISTFREHPFAMVPFQLADKDNSHTNDPERTRGEVVDLELTTEGVDGVISVPDEKTAKLLSQYPNLAVSVRVYEDYRPRDGERTYNNALQHVLGTFEPALSGMSPWQAVQATTPDHGKVIDLSGHDENQHQEGTMPRKAFSEEEQSDLLSRLENFLSMVEGPDDEGTEEDEPKRDPKSREGNGTDPVQQPTESEEGDGSGTDDDEDDLTDEEIADIARTIRGQRDGGQGGNVQGGNRQDGNVQGGQGGSGQPVQEPVAATGGDSRVLEMTAQLKAQERQLRAIQSENDRHTYERERDHFARELGIPPRVVEAARPLLEGQSHTIELSNGSKVDAGKVVREVFAALGQHGRLLDLSVESGSAFLVDEDDEKVRTRQTKVDQLRQQTNIGARRAASNGHSS